jgi:Tol biopolymer transport system component
VSIRDSNEEVYEMKTDGSEQTDLTNAPASDDYEPAWHPGKQ